jgi:hypothetical protein
MQKLKVWWGTDIYIVSNYFLQDIKYLWNEKIISERGNPANTTDDIINNRKIKITGHMTGCHEKNHRIIFLILLSKIHGLSKIIIMHQKNPTEGRSTSKYLRSLRSRKDDGMFQTEGVWGIQLSEIHGSAWDPLAIKDTVDKWGNLKTAWGLNDAMYLGKLSDYEGCILVM